MQVWSGIIRRLYFSPQKVSSSEIYYEEIPEKKKAAIGVRAMKLSVKDSLEQVYVMTDGEDKFITYKEKEVSLQKLKNGTRDQKGTKIRV